MKHKINQIQNKTTTEEATRQWLASCINKGLSASTLQAYDKATAFIVNRWGNRLISDISHKDINSVLDDLRESGLGMTSIALYMGVYKTFCKWANKQELSNINLDGLDTVKRSTPKMVMLSDADVNNMMNSFDTETLEGLRDRAIISFLSTSGLRASELCNLDIADLPSTPTKKGKVGRITIKGKGDKTATIYLTYKTEQYIKEYLSHRLDDDPALFTTIKTSTHTWSRIRREAVYRMVKNVGAQVGVSRPISPHTLRHYTACRYLSHNKNLEAVREIMRHANIGTTQMYLQYGKGEIEDMVAEVMD